MKRKIIKAKPKQIIKGKVTKRPVVKRKSVPLESGNKKTTVKPSVIINHTTKIVNDGTPRHAQPFSKVNKIFTGETVYLIGGGPSLKEFNWEDLKGKNIIAINKAYEFVPWAQVIFWTDARFYTWYHQQLQQSKADKYTINNSIHYDSSVKVLRKGGRHNLEKGDDIIAHGDNSGYAAINLAYILGASQIVLLGYDMGGTATDSHFHNGYPVNATSQKIYESRFMPSFPYIAAALKKEGIPVWNASSVSKLTCFEKISIEKSLRL